jgi:hypothetical protein
MNAVRRVLVALFAGLAFAPAIASAEPPLYLPWTCDEVHHVTNGHQTNSHTGMDAWAWDFGLAVGVEVRAAADGVVRLVKMDSSQGGCDGAYANDANYVVVDFEDGTEALYMHLQKNSSTLQVGDEVLQGDVVGKVGLTGWVCGAHLHFQIQNTCGSWWCQSIPAEFVDFGDPNEDVDMASNNCPVVEPCPLALDGTTTTIDDGEGRCFHRISSWFWPGEGGWEDGHTYTWANDLAEPDSIGRWDFGVDVPGRDRVEAYVPAENASSELATYEINTGVEMVSVGPIDQATQKDWVDLGVHEFVVGDEHWVRLRDNTGESRDLDRALAFDAIRLSWEPEPAGDTSESGGGDGSDGPPPPGGDDDDGAVTTADDGAVGSSGDDGPALPPASDDDDGGGCAIASPRGSGLALVLLALFARVRSRARARAAA